MTHPHVPKPTRAPEHSRRGQAMVELALILPMLLVLLLGIADFGRVFAAGITIEAASRDAAEVAAQEYLRNGPGNPGRILNQPAPLPSDPDYNGTTYYPALHDLAALTACREARILPNTDYAADIDPGTPGDQEGCFDLADPTDSYPVIMTCVHDGVDPYCGDIAFNAPVPSECTELQSTPDPTQSGTAVGEESRYVEVRVCYRFTTLLNLRNLQLPFGWGLSLGDIWIQRTNVFTVGYYPGPTPPPAPTPPPPPPPEPCFAPIASFDAVPISGVSPLDVRFTDTSTDVDCPILTWSWDFGDGSPPSPDQNPLHTFTYGGPDPSVEYTVTLTVASGAGSDQATAVIGVGSGAPPPCEAPTASFDAVPTSGTSPLDVQFTDTSSPVNCPIDTWSWDFGDGSPPDAQQNPPHTFTNPGPGPVDYTVTLTVTSAAGTDQATQVITVSPGP